MSVKIIILVNKRLYFSYIAYTRNCSKCSTCINSCNFHDIFPTRKLEHRDQNWPCLPESEN